MNNRDEDLTLENVDERIEQLMREEKRGDASLHHIVREPRSVYDMDAPAPLADTVRNLQRVYGEEQRLEHIWARINSRAQSLENTTRKNVIEKSTNKQSFLQGEQKTMRDSSSTRPGSFQKRPDGPFQSERASRRRRWLSVGMGLAAAIMLIAVFAWLLSPVFHGTQIGSTGSTPVVNTPTIVTPTLPTPAATPTSPGTPQPTPTQALTPTPGSQNWQTYHGMFFTIQYPASWVVDVVPQESDGMFLQQVEFRPSASSAISLTVGPMYNGEVSPDTLLQNDTLYKSSKIDSQSKVTVDGILWSTAIVETQGTQLAPAKVEIAYASHKHPYRVEFGTPPSQFSANYGTLNAMFQSFQEV